MEHVEYFPHTKEEYDARVAEMKSWSKKDLIDCIMQAHHQLDLVDKQLTREKEQRQEYYGQLMQGARSSGGVTILSHMR